MTNKTKNNKAVGIFAACCLGVLLIVFVGGILSSDSSSSSDTSSYSSSDSSSSDELSNVEYDEDTGVASAQVTCPYCGETAGVATDGQYSAFVCPNCGKTIMAN